MIAERLGVIIQVTYAIGGAVPGLFSLFAPAPLVEAAAIKVVVRTHCLSRSAGRQPVVKHLLQPVM